MKYISFNVCAKYFVWNFKGCLWNFTQNIFTNYWKIRFHSKWKFLELLDFRNHKHFLNAPVLVSWCLYGQLGIFPGSRCWDHYPGTLSSWSSHCNLFEDWVPVDKTVALWYPIFKWQILGTSWKILLPIWQLDYRIALASYNLGIKYVWILRNLLIINLDWKSCCLQVISCCLGQSGLWSFQALLGKLSGHQ